MALEYQAEPTRHIKALKEKLKKVQEVQQPEWAVFVKTGPNKERIPVEKDWWYMRAASVLRKISLDGPVGVSKLRIKYGSRKRNGHKTAHFVKSSGKIIRTILQQLELAGLIKQTEAGAHKGRTATPMGKSLLDKTAIEVVKAQRQEAKNGNE